MAIISELLDILLCMSKEHWYKWAKLIDLCHKKAIKFAFPVNLFVWYLQKISVTSYTVIHSRFIYLI